MAKNGEKAHEDVATCYRALYYLLTDGWSRYERQIRKGTAHSVRSGENLQQERELLVELANKLAMEGSTLKEIMEAVGLGRQGVRNMLTHAAWETVKATHSRRREEERLEKMRQAEAAKKKARAAARRVRGLRKAMERKHGAAYRRIVALRKSGLSQPAIARQVGYSTENIQYICAKKLTAEERAALDCRVTRNWKRPELREQILALRAEGHTMQDIALQYKCSTATVYDICNGFGRDADGRSFTHTTSTERDSILALRQSGMTIRQIAAATRRGMGTVCAIIKEAR